MYISILLLALFPVAVNAQERVIYEDTSLLQKPEVTEAPAEDQVEEVVPGEKITESYTLDTTLYHNRLDMSYDSIRKWRNLKEFAYSSYLDSLLKKQKKEKAPEPTEEPAGGGFLNSLLGSGIFSLIVWVAAILFVMFVIYRLFLADAVFKRRSTPAREKESTTAEEVITRESDFDALIRNALQNNNYRLAIRYQYLRTLHLLAGKNLVQLSPDKTNFQYVREISNYNQQQDFAALTLHYEYVWYGEFVIDKDIYQQIENSFISLNQKL